MKRLSEEHCFICNRCHRTSPGLVFVESSWRSENAENVEYLEYYFHRECFVTMLGMNRDCINDEYTYEEWLELAGEQYVLEEENTLVGCDGTITHFLKDRCHNLHGPAIIYRNGTCSYYIAGEKCSEDDFPRKVAAYKRKIAKKKK